MQRDFQLPPAGKDAGGAANQSNIARITAELGRHDGDLGEVRRIAALTRKRQSDNPSDTTKARRKKGKHPPERAS